MADERACFRVGRRPEHTGRLPFVLAVPVSGEPDLVLAAGAAWPDLRDVFCHALDAWPEGTEEIERVPVVRCWRQGAALHLILDRRQRRRSTFVFTARNGRPLIFWRTPKTTRQARPGIRVPLARAARDPLEVVVDTRERYPWKFRGRPATVRRAALAAGDYAVVGPDGPVAVVERKSVEDLYVSLQTGDLRLTLADLSTLPRAALFVEGRLSDLLKRDSRRAARLMDLVAALIAEFPQVGWHFGETRPLAEEMAWRWLAAASRVGASAGHPRPGEASRPVPAAPERRAVGVRLAQAGRTWTASDWARYFGVSAATAAQDLAALRADGALDRRREGRRVYYAAPDADLPSDPG